MQLFFWTLGLLAGCEVKLLQGVVFSVGMMFFVGLWYHWCTWQVTLMPSWGCPLARTCLGVPKFGIGWCLLTVCQFGSALTVTLEEGCEELLALIWSLFPSHLSTCLFACEGDWGHEFLVLIHTDVGKGIEALVGESMGYALDIAVCPASKYVIFLYLCRSYISLSIYLYLPSVPVLTWSCSPSQYEVYVRRLLPIPNFLWHMHS